MLKKLDIIVSKINTRDLYTQDHIVLTEYMQGDQFIGGFHQVENKHAYFVVALMREPKQ